jgi:hypothetical protein
VALAGDVDGDGVGDVLVGSPVGHHGPFGKPGPGLLDPGVVRVHSGAGGRLLLRVEGLNAGDGFGTAVAGAGDLNGDHRADFIVGAPYGVAGGQANAGYALVLSGKDGRRLYLFEGSRFEGAEHAGWTGAAVAGGADINGDGVPDLLVGSPEWFGGEVAAYSGKDGSRLLLLSGRRP